MGCAREENGAGESAGAGQGCVECDGDPAKGHRARARERVGEAAGAGQGWARILGGDGARIAVAGGDGDAEILRTLERAVADVHGCAPRHQSRESEIFLSTTYWSESR